MNHPPRPLAAAPRASAGGYQPFAGHASSVVTDTLDRILASRTFRRSQRHKTFLRHVVRAAASGHHEDLKEVVIGLEVFGRDIAHYDPRRDPIVRVEAGRVREKLARYYADEGVGDAFEIQIPVGGYLPQLSRRAASKAATTHGRGLGSFAVLPFTSLSSNPDDALFCEALADQVIDLLSRVAGVRVIGRQSAIKARKQSVDIKVVGKMLGVGHVIEGSLQRAGSRLRCVAQLYRTRDRVCIWSERFDDRMVEDRGVEGGDLFVFQDRVADAITAAISTMGTSSVPAAMDHEMRVYTSSRRTTTSTEARDLYERARYLVQRRTNEGLEKGVALLERSIALEPDFAQAHSQLGIARSAFYGIMARPTLPAFREVEQCARRALELDPLDGDARALIADIAFRVDRDWPRAEPLFREALRIAPNSARAHVSYAATLVFNGRWLEAIDHARIALDLDPLNITYRIHLAIITAYARDFATSIAEFRSILDIDPEHFFAQFMLGSVYLWAGAGHEAMKHFEIASRIDPDHPIPRFDLVMAHGLMGHHAQARQMLDALLTSLEGKPHQLYNKAMAEAYLGDVTALCATLRRSAEAHELLFVSAPADPSFDRYRDDPAFIALMDEYGLPRLARSPFASTASI